MQDGVKPYESIEKDPRLNFEVDEKYDLKSMKAYTKDPSLQSQKTMLANEGRNVKAVSEKTEKQVEKVLDLARAARARV